MAAPFSRADLRLIHPEIVRHLVPDGVLDQLCQVFGERAIRSCGPWKMVMRSGIAKGSNTLRA